MLPFARVTIIGLGLIGSSVARAVRETMPTVRVTGYDADRTVRETADRLQFCDDVASSAGAAVIDAEDLERLTQAAEDLADIEAARAARGL